MRGATAEQQERKTAKAISIHAPLAGCDGHEHGRQIVHRQHFNPRTPCGVRLPVKRMENIDTGISIHAPLAGCDRLIQQPERRPHNFNPRTPCGVRHGATRQKIEQGAHFNPRTPCGVRRPMRRRWTMSNIFQSTHPLRGATPSVHKTNGVVAYFNPRTPCGVRPATTTPYRRPMTFQSTHPLRGATGIMSSTGKVTLISIHAPLAGCDT